MDEFGYLSVLISIILGLALAQLILGLGRIIQLRKHVDFYWPALVWVGILLIINIQTWWAMFSLRNLHDWTFLGFLVVLLHPLALFMVATLAVPDQSEFVGEGRVNLKANYFNHHRWFFGAIMLVIVASIARPFVLGGAMAPEDAAVQAFLFLMAVIGLAARAEWYHKLLAAIVPLTLALYIGGLFGRL